MRPARWTTLLDRHRLHPAAVLLTHGHIDHTFSVVPVCEAKDVPAWIHPDDRGQLTDPLGWIGVPPGTPLMGMPSLPDGRAGRPAGLADGETLELAGLASTVRHAPGHTLGSVVFTSTPPTSRCCSPATCCSPARSAAPTCPAARTRRSSTRWRGSCCRWTTRPSCSPGHGPDTTVGRERAGNPYLQLATEQG